MATPWTITYTDNSSVIYAAWLNGMDTWANGVYGVLGSTYTAGAFRTALGSTTVGDSLFTAANAGAGRTILGAAASGANADITSVGAITGVTAATADSSTLLATTSHVSAKAIGVNQTWQTPVRALATPYTNNTGKPIMVAVSISSTIAGASILATVGGVSLYGTAAGTPGWHSQITFIVPNGTIYSITANAGTPTLLVWAELTA